MVKCYSVLKEYVWLSLQINFFIKKNQKVKIENQKSEITFR